MKKLKIKGIKKEMSTTGTGASFAPGIGAQYATSKAFKKKTKEEGPNWSKLRQGQLGIAKTSPVSKQVDVSEPFTTLSPSIPNRKSKAIDYVKLFEKSIDQYLAGINSQADKKYKKWNPVTDFTDSQANAGDNTGYDMDTQDAASVSELAKFADKSNKLKIGDTDIDKGVKYTVTDIDKTTGAIQWKVNYVPAYDTVYKEFEELRSTLNTLAVKTDDTTIDGLSDEIRNVFNRYRTHIRKNYPDAYKKFRTNENINEQADYKYLTQVILDANPKMNVYYSSSRNVVNIGGVGYDKGDLVKNFNQPQGSSTKIKNNFYYANENPVDTKQEVERLSNGKIKVDIQKGYGNKPMVVYSVVKSLNERLGVSKDKLNNIVKFVGAVNFTQMIISLRDENVQDEIVSAFEDQYPAVMDKRDDLQEVRYSRFKKEAKLRTPTEQIHRAVREIRQRMNEMLKIVGHTERMKNELKQSNEGMSYLKRTKNALGSISEKLQELTNRIKGLTE